MAFHVNDLTALLEKQQKHNEEVERHGPPEDGVVEVVLPSRGTCSWVVVYAFSY